MKPSYEDSLSIVYRISVNSNIYDVELSKKNGTILSLAHKQSKTTWALVAFNSLPIFDQFDITPIIKKLQDGIKTSKDAGTSTRRRKRTPARSK